MESFGFGLRLVDEASAPAKRIQDSVRQIEAQASKTEAALSGRFAGAWEKIGFAAARAGAKQQAAFSGSWDKIGKAASKAADKAKDAVSFHKQIESTEARIAKLKADPKGYQNLLRQQKELSEMQERLGGKSETFGKGFGGSFGLITTAAAAGELLAEGVMKVGEGLVEAAHKVVEIFTEGIATAFEESGKRETTRLQFKLSLGDKGGKEALEDIERFSKMTGFTHSQIEPIMLGLRRAGFSQKSARSAFAAGTDVEAGGGMKAAEFADFAEHVMLKGGVTTKQLVGANINAPEFFKSLGKKLGISASAAEKRAKEGGKIDPQMMLNQIYEGIEKTQGGQLGTGGIAASKTFEKRWAKLKALPGEYFEKLVDSPGFKSVSDAFGSLLEKLDPETPTGKRIMASVDRMFGKITGWLDGLASDDGIDSIVSGVESLVGLFGDLLPSLKGLSGSLQDAADFVADMVGGFRMIAAISSGDKGEINRIALEQVGRTHERMVRMAQRKQDAESRDAEKAGLGNGPLIPDMNSPLAVPTPVKGKTTTIAPVFHVTVQGNAGEDPEHTGQKVAESAHKHTAALLEKEAQMAGAQ